MGLIFTAKLEAKDSREFTVAVPHEVSEIVGRFFQKIQGANGSYATITLDFPRRPMTKGYRSQLSRHWGHCQCIADQLSTADRQYKKDDVDYALRRMAVREGLPTLYNVMTDSVDPTSASQWSVEDASIVEKVKQRYCDEHGLYLIEYDEQDGKATPYLSLCGRSKKEMDAYLRDYGGF